MNVEQIKRFKAELIWRLHGVRRLRSDEWEEIVAHALNGERKLSTNYLADVVAKTTMLSVKSIHKGPTLLKTKPSRDLRTNPVTSLIVWERRIQTPEMNLDSLDAGEIMEYVFKDYCDFEQRSLDHYNCEKTLDFCIIHGVDVTNKLYLARLIINQHDAQFKLQPIKWRKQSFTKRSKNNGLNFIIGDHDGQPIFKWTTPNSAHTTRCLGKRHAVNIGRPKVIDIAVKMPELIRPSDSDLLNEFDEVNA
jgi:hypothetical protein